jgi:hypothetical protein
MRAATDKARNVRLRRDDLVAMMPGAASVADRVTPALNTPARAAAFLAQLAHASGEL